MKRKSVVYTRVSTDKDEQKLSLEVQQEYYEQYSGEKGYELVDIYADVGSGTNVRQRPYFIHMLEAAGLDYEANSEGTDIFRTSKRKSKFDVIIVKNAPRFSRNNEIGMATVKLLRSKNVEVVFENAGVSSFDENANLTLSLLFTIAENESAGMSKSIKFTKLHNAQTGVYNPSRLPYGYERNEAKEKVINEDQAWVVRFINDNYPEQGTLILSRRLNEKGLLTQLGRKWTTDKVLRIIINTSYYGSPTVNRTKKVDVTDTKRVENPEKEWIVMKDALPAIITKEQHDFNNEVRKSRVNKTTKRGRRPTVNDIYFEKLWCADCGFRFARHIGHQKKITYMCQNRRKGLGCQTRGISVQLVTGFFDRVDISSLSNSMGNYGYYNLLMKHLALAAKSLKKRVDELTGQIEALEEENRQTLAGIKEQFKGGSEDVIGMLTDDIESNKAKISELDTLRSKINIQAIHDIRERTENKRLLIEDIQESKGISQEEKLKLLKTITVSDNDVKVEFHFPNYQQEIEDFNKIFTTDQIETEMGFKPFTETYRREHKAAREYWEEIDFARGEQEEHFRDNPLMVE